MNHILGTPALMSDTEKPPWLVRGLYDAWTPVVRHMHIAYLLKQGREGRQIPTYVPKAMHWCRVRAVLRSILGLGQGSGERVLLTTDDVFQGLLQGKR